jgi:hypothetical protein
VPSIITVQVISYGDDTAANDGASPQQSSVASAP